MKKLILFSLLIVTTLFACTKLKDLLRFDINFTTQITIPATGSINQALSFFGQDVSTNTTETFKNNGTNADLVKEIKLKACKLVITSPNGQNFDFLKDITVYIVDKDGNNKQKIAYKTNIPETQGSTLELDVDNSVHLDSYVKAESFKISCDVTQRKSTFNDITIDTKLTFNVLADPL